MYATQKMMEVQLPFPLKKGELDDFWMNHTIRKNPNDKHKKMVPMIPFRFEEIEVSTVTIYYKGKEATIDEDTYDHWMASWWALRGASNVKERLGLGFFDDIPASEYPQIKEIQ